ncbi:hypothetical protein ES707_21218 [subsurface metagenome]
MDYHRAKSLKENHPTIRLLNADNCPLIISFLFQSFKKSNRASISNDELVSSLTDNLYLLRSTYGDDVYPETAQYYLDNWANSLYLRKYYLPNIDEPHFELTPATEKVLEWLKDLEKREFVGTESRLIRVIEILREIVYRTADDPAKRLEDLERQRDEIDNEIEKIKSGFIDKLSQTQIKERYYEAYDTSNKLLSDFKQIEYNFRQLDQEIREKQVKNDLNKGEFLEEIFSSQDILLDSDQGRSFRAFWQLLMSQSEQDELDDLIDAIIALPEIQTINKDDTLEELKSRLIEAGDRVNKTNHILTEQLRKYLDDKVYLEDKKVIEIIKEIKKLAVLVRDNLPNDKDFLVIEDRPKIEMIMERPLWDASKSPELKKIDLEEGSSEFVDAQKLYEQFNVNPEELKTRINEMLETHSQITLKSIVDRFPVERGLAEVLTYVSIASKDEKALINEENCESLILWNKTSNRYFKIELPQIIFCR